MTGRLTPEGFRQVAFSKPDGTVRYTYKANSIETICSQKTLKRAIKRRYRRLFSQQDPVDQIRRHLNMLDNHFFLSMDIASAFDSVTAERMTEIIDLENLLAEYELDFDPNHFFHADGGLIQGGCASSHLFELYCQRTIDQALRDYLYTIGGLRYTRYADDLLISSPRFISRNVRKGINKRLAEYGFRSNSAKTKSCDIRATPLHVIGLEISSSVERIRVFSRSHDVLVTRAQPLPEFRSRLESVRLYEKQGSSILIGMERWNRIARARRISGGPVFNRFY